MLTPRQYQIDALTALNKYLCEKDGNPCVVIPTGGGKSALIAWAIQSWRRTHPKLRCIILAHRKELIEQNAAEIEAVYPECHIGIFAAGLSRRDYDANILFASIDSVYKRAGIFSPWDVIMVDEAHRIPFKGEGKYRTFIEESAKWSNGLRVVGWTATPYRMAGGRICHKDHILNDICYEVSITELISKDYLCRLRSKVGQKQPDLKDVRRNSGGDYIVSSLAEVTNRQDLVAQAVKEALRIIHAERRKAAVFFCVNVEHCKQVSGELKRYGINAPAVTNRTPATERRRIAEAFKTRKLPAVCNVNVYTEGFNARHVDCIVLLRPTLSPGLYAQMVGRGLRMHENKHDCLILDFAGCIEEHGPIDLLWGEPVRMATCEACRESFSRNLGACPACGWVIPKKEVKRLEEAERTMRMHGKKASEKSILSDMPHTYAVDAVYVNRHCKGSNPDSLRVQYKCNDKTFAEWVCLEHEGYAGMKAQEWCRMRGISYRKGGKITIADVLSDMFFSQHILEWTKTVTIKRNGKYRNIIAYNQPLPEYSESTA